MTRRPLARRGLVAAVCCLAWLVPSGPASILDAQEGTAFPFPSRLAIDGDPVDTDGKPGPYDFTYRAFDGERPGESRQLGPSLLRRQPALEDGRFTTELDFGSAIPSGARVWIETTVTRADNGAELVARSRRPATIGAPREPAAEAARPAVAPATSDAEILARLGAVRVVISDRQTPGEPHFLVDEASFRRAYGLGAPVTATDVASIAIVSASELSRQAGAARQQVAVLEAEVDRLRFRSNLTLILLGALVVSLLVHRRLVPDSEPERDKLEGPPEPADETPG
ncbi:MAG: hypothetical protein AAGN46_14485 [Acidobacteriota bacterium]